ncbi:hypothetical protein K435DRAFT_592688, partial [Dendrothele bispora CBS 962.96]
DHIGHWNWCKVIGLGSILKRRLVNAVAEFQRHFEPWVDFTKQQRRHAPTWKKMVDDFKPQVSDVNPYALPMNAAEDHGSAEETDGEDEDSMNMDTTPSKFLYFGLKIEQQQIELQHDISNVRSPTNRQLTRIVDRRTKLSRQIKRFRALQLHYTPAALHIIATVPLSKTRLNPEDLPLYFPSQLFAAQQSTGPLSQMELRLRDGQLNESLNQLRHLLLAKQRLLRYKKTNARNQGPNIRIRRLISRQDKRIKVVVSIYRAAWKAKLALLNGDKSLLGWNELLDEHVRGMEDLQESEKKKIKAAKGKR